MSTGRRSSRPSSVSSPRSVDTKPAELQNFTDDEREAQVQIQADVQQLLTEMQTSFKSFSEDMFSKIDAMQDKITALQNNVADIANNVPHIPAASAGEDDPSSDPETHASDPTPAP